jgi:Diaminopimelate decarboxylase
VSWISPLLYYISAVKCNDSVTVLEVLAALGTGFDCASKVSILHHLLATQNFNAF